MHHLQRFSRCFVSARYVAINYSSSSATQILTKDIADKSSLKTGGNAAPVNPRTKNPIVEAAFASINKDNETTDEDSKNISVDEKIINAKTVNGLLSISDASGTLSRKHALKVVSILADWSSINRVNLSEFENDSRFIKLCRVLGRSVANKPTVAKKQNGFRTDDLTTVLGVTGDDEAAKLIGSISLPQMVKVMSTLAHRKRRSTPLLRSLSFNISSNPGKLDLKQSADLLFSTAVLNFPDPLLIAKVCTDVQLELPNNDDRPAVVGSILTSLGLLKYRNSEILEALTDWVLTHSDKCRPQDICSLFMTLATLNYTSGASPQLKKTLVNQLTESDLKKSMDWLDYVWALSNLGFVNSTQVESVLREEFINKLFLECAGSLSPTTKMKLLNINAISKLLLPDYNGIRLSEESSIFSVPFLKCKTTQTLVNGMLDALKSLMTSDTYVKVHNDTKMGFVIDAECYLDKKCNPLPVDSSQADGTRIAIMVLDFHDMCQGSHLIPNGMSALALKLLESKGYTVVTIPYSEFNTSDKLIKRVQYLESKLKGCLNVK